MDYSGDGVGYARPFVRILYSDSEWGPSRSYIIYKLDGAWYDMETYSQQSWEGFN